MKAHYRTVVILVILAALLAGTFAVYKNQESGFTFPGAFLCSDIGREDLTEEFLFRTFSKDEAPEQYELWKSKNLASQACNNIDRVTYED